MAKDEPKYLKTVSKKKTRRIPLIPLFVFLVVISIIATVPFIGGAVAKYIQENTGDAVVKAKEFYFTSDYLSAEGSDYILNEGVDTFTFELRNYEDPNVAELDINYTVSVVSDGEDTVIPTPAEGILTCDEKNSQTVTLSGLVGGNTYIITAAGSNGYSQTLTATVTVKSSNTGVYQNTQVYADYVLLTLWTGNYTASLNIEVPDGLIPDATDSALTDVSAGGTISLSLGAYESRTFRFFTTSGYDGTPFTVTCYGYTVPEGTLD